MNYDLPPPPASAAVSNIADLAYRNYEGPLLDHKVRWWIIARSSIQTTFKKPAFWVAIAFCLLPYLIHGAIFYFTQQMQEQVAAMGAAGNLLGGGNNDRYGQLFYNSLCGNTNELSMFVIALMIGAGSIAADNRANALMVYLSKPLTKRDYLIGKWMGIFLTLWMVALLPCLLLFLFCAVLYASEGFLKENPTLFLRVLASSLIIPLVHSCVLTGFSAWSKSPRMVGSIYAGIYFVGGILASLLGHSLFPYAPEKNNLVQHFSLNGIMEGVIQNILHIPLTRLFWQQPDDPTLGIPPVTALAVAVAAACIAGVVAARAKIKAVEVVRG